jgi:hypothetical protein
VASAATAVAVADEPVEETPAADAAPAEAPADVVETSAAPDTDTETEG